MLKTTQLTILVRGNYSVTFCAITKWSVSVLCPESGWEAEKNGRHYPLEMFFQLSLVVCFNVVKDFALLAIREYRFIIIIIIIIIINNNNDNNFDLVKSIHFEFT